MQGNSADDLPADAWNVTARLIERINGLTQERGGRLCLVRIPSKGETLWPDAYAQFGQNLRAIAQTSHIDYIELLPYLQATPLRTYYRDGIHWTPHGHDIVARVLGDYLDRSPPGARRESSD
ncbi:MAG: hypothetical protein O3C57_04660 [Verrucomicrobia bacterium]|nr:hypothetical protein [Verrucomicrobiota bacterium]